MVMAANAVNQQDAILNQLRKERAFVIIHLVNGFQLRGVIKGFDNFVIIIENENKQQLVYKHAVSTITFTGPLSSPNIKTE